MAKVILDVDVDETVGTMYSFTCDTCTFEGPWVETMAEQIALVRDHEASDEHRMNEVHESRAARRG